MSVTEVYTLCQKDSWLLDAQPFGVVHVVGYALTPARSGGLPGASVLFARPFRPRQVFRHVVVRQQGSTSTSLGLKIYKRGLVIMWPENRVIDTPPTRVPVNVKGKLFCRDLKDYTSYYVNGQGKPYLYGWRWTRA